MRRERERGRLLFSFRTSCVCGLEYQWTFSLIYFVLFERERERVCMCELVREREREEKRGERMCVCVCVCVWEREREREREREKGEERECVCMCEWESVCVKIVNRQINNLFLNSAFSRVINWKHVLSTSLIYCISNRNNFIFRLLNTLIRVCGQVIKNGIFSLIRIDSMNFNDCKVNLCLHLQVSLIEFVRTRR